MSDIAIRPLVAADVPAYVVLRRRGLVEIPAAFAASLDDDVTSRPQIIVDGLAGGPDLVTFGAFAGSELVGCVGISREARTKMRHKAVIWGMYVAPEARGGGLARRLLEAAIDHGRSLPVRWLHLSVSVETPAAQRLYERLGFVTWGVEPEALVVAGRFIDERHMVLRLAP